MLPNIPRRYLLPMALTLLLCIAAASSLLVQNRKILLVGMDANFAPFGYLSEQGEFIGFDIDLAEKIAEELGRRLQIKDIPYIDLLPALSAGKVDMVISALPIRKENLAEADFSLSYYDASQVVVTLAKQKKTLLVPEDLLHLSVAVEHGSLGAFEVEMIKGTANHESIRVMEYAGEGFAELMAGGVESIIVDRSIAELYASQHVDLRISDVFTAEEKYAIAVRTGNKSLLDQTNEVLIDLMDSGEFEQMLGHWFGPCR